MRKTAIIQRSVQGRILVVRGQKVLFDSDLAQLYGVTVKRLNEQVKRNRERFPEDFMFRLNSEETASLRSQFATSNKGRGGRRSLPFVFTEHGAMMAASVLNSARAVEMSLFVVRAFVRLRNVLGAHKELAARVARLQRRLGTHDVAIAEIVEAVRSLMDTPKTPRKQIGFRTGQPANPKQLKATAGR